MKNLMDTFVLDKPIQGIRNPCQEFPACKITHFFQRERGQCIAIPRVPKSENFKGSPRNPRKVYGKSKKCKESPIKVIKA